MRLATGMLLILLVSLTARAEDANQQVLLKAADISVTQQDVRQRLLLLPEVERNRILATPQTLKEFLQRIYQIKNMAATAAKLRLDQEPLIKAQLAVQQQQTLAEALREHTRKQIAAPDFAALAKEHYAAQRDEFQLPEQFKAAHILKKVRCDCEREAARQTLEKLLTRLQAGEDFAAIAKEESQDTGSAVKGGDLGKWFKATDMVQPFSDALAKLQPGQLSGIVETEYGYHIIKSLDRQAPRLQSFDEVRASLEQRLRDTYVDAQLKERSIAYFPPKDAQFNEAALNEAGLQALRAE